MRRRTARMLRVGALALVALGGASAARAQDTTQRGVRIGLTYAPGTKPGVLVLPASGGLWGDSVRAILQRDLDYGDRVTVVGADSAGRAVVPPASGVLNYQLYAKLGAAAVVQPSVANGTLHVAVHDVAAARVAQVFNSSMPGSAFGSPEWRMVVHGAADEIERAITGVRGIAGTRILFVQGNRVYVVDSDGANLRALSEGGRVLSPAWHPSGAQIAYSTLGGSGWSIVMRDAGGGGRTRTLPTGGGLNVTPAFSPDGRTLVYSHADEQGSDLVALSVEGDGSSRRVTVGRGTDNVSPTFSPDGRRIAFTSSRSGHPEVYITDVDGTNAELLTPFLAGDRSYRSNPDWSPDGRTIAFQSQLDGRFQIMTITLRDRRIKQHTSEGVNEDASWAPDSRHLVFTSTRTGTKQLHVLDTESGRVRQLTRGGGGPRLAAWSPPLVRAP
ncbi:MAG TPA: hypothetical protein VKA84_13720 [Gemmatimonadaceae bacterium]|nr:hypothetical protein [Gemmatimonadaceae bacterium]